MIAHCQTAINITCLARAEGLQVGQLPRVGRHRLHLVFFWRIYALKHWFQLWKSFTFCSADCAVLRNDTSFVNLCSSGGQSVSAILGILGLVNGELLLLSFTVSVTPVYMAVKKKKKHFKYIYKTFFSLFLCTDFRWSIIVEKVITWLRKCIGDWLYCRDI